MLSKLFPSVTPTFNNVPLFMLPNDVIEDATNHWERSMARKHLAAYAYKAMDLLPATHHQLICAAIDDLLNDQYDELIILAPPGSAKSSYTSHALSSYFMGRHPERNIILATHTSDLSERWSRKVRNTLTSPEHQLIFPASILSKDSTSVSRWATTEGGELLAAGVGGAILGFRADLGVIDDPIGGFEQAQSITQLGKVHDWYETDFVTRLKPEAKTVLICQRLARNDLAGYLIDRNISNPTKRQFILKLPMLCVDPTTDPLHREQGDRLWPEWYTEQMVMDAKRDDFKWRTLYQQEPPSDTGSWASTEDFRFAPTPAYDPKLNYYVCCDLALSVGTGDYTVMLTVAHDPTTQRVHIVDLYRRRVDPDESSDALVALVKTYKPLEVLIDDDNAAKVWMQLVATRARSQSTPVNWHPLPMRGQNKEVRAAALRGMFKRGMVWFDPSKDWTNIIINECLQFPNALGSGVDDCVDSLSLMGRRLTYLQAQSTVTLPSPQLTIQSMTLDKLFADQPRRSSRL